MLKSEVQLHFWVTKKAVERKFLRSREDEHIVSSDAELDSKIEIYKGIHETCSSLNKILDKYQESLCILSQEECVFGKFLKEVGKKSKSTAQCITNAGKAISYCGQQRISMRAPVLRLQHEVDVFRYRAIGDTQFTLSYMEKQRTEYRAALYWMKSTSAELDPDSGKGLLKFRRAQSRVRETKRDFDRMSLDSIQKIDLLAAARCNMFSHTLVSYIAVLLQFSKKASKAFESISSVLATQPRYGFKLLKELSPTNDIFKKTLLEEITTTTKDHTEPSAEKKQSNAETELEQSNLLVDVADLSDSPLNSKSWFNPNESDNVSEHMASINDNATNSPAMESYKNNKYDNQVKDNATILWENILEFDLICNSKL